MTSNVENTNAGSLLAGAFFNTYLYGFVTYQFAVYYQTKYNDSLLTKYSVLFLFVVDTCHSASVIYMAWNYIATILDDSIATAQWPYSFTPIATAFTALVTQIYLGLRIWRYTCSNFLFGVVIVLAVPSFVLGITCGAGTWIVWIWSELPDFTPLAITWLVTQVAVDLFICGTSIVTFYRSRIGSHRVDTVLNRLIRGAIQTGVFPAIFSLSNLISFMLSPNTSLCVMFTIPIGRIYTNTLMDTLLCRDALKAELGGAMLETGAAIDVFDRENVTSGSSASSPGIQPQVQKFIRDVDERSCCEVPQSRILPQFSWRLFKTRE